MHIVVQGVLIGVIATLGMDVWAAIAKHLLHLPTSNWAMVGRWFGHMPRGVFVHRPIADATPVAHELTIGWAAHYATGIVYGVLYMAIVHLWLSGEPTLATALGFGLVTLVAPWFVMQPAMGVGVFASKAPQPGRMRLVNVSMHALFGAALYGAWRLLQCFTALIEPVQAGS